MAKKKNKFYVVWQGRNKGVFDSWAACEKQVKGVKGAKFKGFPTRGAAEQAFRGGAGQYIRQRQAQKEKQTTTATPEWRSLSVDAACSGNPGLTEYQGVDTQTGQRWFHFKLALGTNNIGEFLALVHGLIYLKKHELDMPIYTDSRIAMNWVKKGECRSTFKTLYPESQAVELIEKAEAILRDETFSTRILKWDTKSWGEIPADFGRK